jgi:hypothetical protein
VLSISGDADSQARGNPIDQSPNPSPPAPDIEFLRRLHSSIQGWYTIAETKAQLLIAFNGAFVTVIVGAIFGKIEDVRALVDVFGAETWILLLLSLAAPVGAVACAVACLWSQHRKSRRDFNMFGVDPSNPATYHSAILWYFAHLAQLPVESTVERLRHVDREAEVDTLAFGITRLAGKVLRKHRLINAGWAFSAVALLAITATGVSVLTRA